MKGFLETLIERKQEIYDSHTSNTWFEGDKATEDQENIDNLTSLASEVDDVITELENTYEL
jgi:hypothetical protein